MGQIKFNESYTKIYKETNIPKGSEGTIVTSPTQQDVLIRIGDNRYIFSFQDIQMLQKKGLITIVNEEFESW